LRLDATWQKGCSSFLIASWKNKVMDLQLLRDVGGPVTDLECQGWLSGSLLMHSQTRTAPGNLASEKSLNAMAPPIGIGAAATAKQMSFNNLCDCMLSQAHAIKAALKLTNKETRPLLETERTTSGRSGGRDPTPVVKVLEEAEDVVVASEWAMFCQRNGQQ
jgi:hypothetical protein